LDKSQFAALPTPLTMELNQAMLMKEAKLVEKWIWKVCNLERERERERRHYLQLLRMIY
jgi:hypothetical protein